MRSSAMVTMFGIAAVVAAIGVLFLSGPNESEEAKTPADFGRRLFRVQGCSSCHAIGGGISRGPDLAAVIPRLRARLADSEYRKHLSILKKSREDIYALFTTEYDNVLKAQGDERIRVWFAQHLNNPRFDHYLGQMPSFAHLTAQQVGYLTAFIFTLQ